MKVFTHCIHSEKVVFNNTRSSRNQILCAFGRLKANYSISTKKIDLKLENIPYISYACFILHNFCELSNFCELIQTHVKEIYNDVKILQSYQANIFLCNRDEG